LYAVTNYISFKFLKTFLEITILVAKKVYFKRNYKPAREGEFIFQTFPFAIDNCLNNLESVCQEWQMLPKWLRFCILSPFYSEVIPKSCV